MHYMDAFHIHQCSKNNQLWEKTICHLYSSVKIGKAMTDRIDSVLCNKEEEISIVLSSQKLESSVNLYVASAEDSVLEAGALSRKVEVLEIINTTFSDRSIIFSNS